jgi:hypothetical protein
MLRIRYFNGREYIGSDLPKARIKPADLQPRSVVVPAL